MTYTSTGYQVGPSFTPEIVKKLIIFTVAVSIASALFDPIFHRVCTMMGPQDWLSLSPLWSQRLFLWQPATYFFVHPSQSGIHFFFLLQLFFNMYLLWVSGSTLIQELGKRSFLRLYFLCGLFSGVCTLASMYLLGIYGRLAGCHNIVLGLLFVWTMFYPRNLIQFFFAITLEARWLIAIFIGATVLIDISQLDIIGLISTLSSVGFAYIFSVAAWDLRSPFPVTHGMDQAIASLGASIQEKWNKNRSSSPNSSGKIFDIHTGAAIDTEESFMNRMLDKISSEGEDSLSWLERRKMRKISERKKKED